MHIPFIKECKKIVAEGNCYEEKYVRDKTLLFPYYVNPNVIT